VKGDEFIREVDEAVRQDRWLDLWKAYGTYVVGGALAVVLGTAAGMGWREWQESSRLADAERFAEATRMLESDRPQEAAEAFASLVGSSDGGYAVLARLRMAEANARSGDEAARNEALAALADDGDAGELYRELSELLLLQGALGEIGTEQALDRLEPLIAGPWRHSALEMKALVEMQAGAEVEARETLALLLSDPMTPPGVGRRASELLQALGGPVQDLDEDGADEAGGSS
jgi:hypothetical protein